MRVTLSPSARDDLRTVYRFYAERGSADRVVGAILKAANGLADFPHLGKLGAVPGTRERIVIRYPYRVVYLIAGSTIEILRVIHTAQEWP